MPKATKHIIFIYAIAKATNKVYNMMWVYYHPI